MSANYARRSRRAMLHSPDPPQRKAEAAREAEPGAALPETNLRDRLSDIAWPLGVSLGALLLWEALCRGFGVRPILLPPSSAILAAMVTRGDLLFANLWPSVYQTVLAFLLSVVGGVLLGILITYSVTARKGFYPLIVISQVVPKISIAPLFIVWFGTGAASNLLYRFRSFYPLAHARTDASRCAERRSHCDPPAGNGMPSAHDAGAVLYNGLRVATEIRRSVISRSLANRRSA